MELSSKGKVFESGSTFIASKGQLIFFGNVSRKSWLISIPIYFSGVPFQYFLCGNDPGPISQIVRPSKSIPFKTL